jgi:hypothetical protein
MKTLRNFLIALGVTFTAYVLIEGNNPTFSLPDWDLESFFTADDSDNSALYNQEMEDKDVYISKENEDLAIINFYNFCNTLTAVCYNEVAAPDKLREIRNTFEAVKKGKTPPELSTKNTLLKNLKKGNLSQGVPNVLSYDKYNIEKAYKELKANIITIVEARESIIADFNKPLQGRFVEQKIGNFERLANHLITMQSELNALLQNHITTASEHLMEDNRQATTFYNYQEMLKTFENLLNLLERAEAGETVDVQEAKKLYNSLIEQHTALKNKPLEREHFINTDIFLVLELEKQIFPSLSKLIYQLTSSQKIDSTIFWKVRHQAQPLLNPYALFNTRNASYYEYDL